MFEAFSFQNLTKGDIVAGVEVEILSEGWRINYVLLKKRKGILKIISSSADIKGLEKFITIANKEIPLSISISGKGIISKKGALSENENENSLLHKALPNANKEDFYVQKIGMTNDQAIISAARKSIVDELLHNLHNAGYFIVDVSFGPFAIVPLFHLLNFSGGDSLNFCGNRMQFINGELNDYHYEVSNSNEQIEIAGEILDERCLNSFASGLSYFILNEKDFPVPRIGEMKNEFKHKKLFYSAGWGALMFFFTLLLFNFFLFSHFKTKSEELNMNVFRSKDELAKISSLQNELLQKQIFLNRLGLLESSKTSFFSDRIASHLPAEIRLSEMFVFPLEKKTAGDKKELNFIPNTIHISGRCIKSTEFNDWVKILKGENWIQNVNLINYSQENQSEFGEFQIEINVKLND